MSKRLAAIAFIFVCASIAWIILGATTFVRTEHSDARLGKAVASNWGTAQEQRSPRATFERPVVKEVENVENGVTIKREVHQTEAVPVPLERSRVTVGLALEYRQKGLLWYSTYRVVFGGTYLFRNTSQSDSLTITLPFPAAQAVYDDVTFLVNGVAVATRNSEDGVTATVPAAPGSTIQLVTGYHSQGQTSWRYVFGDGVSSVNDFGLQVRTNFHDVDFADNTLSPTTKRETKDGWALDWTYRNMVSGYPVGIVMPEHVQPGPLAGRIALFAPVSLFFFFFLMFVITTVRGIELHPMHYFFLAAAFFAFHLLLSYLADHISIHVAFVIASLVSIGLVVSYLRLVIDMRFALREAALAQLLFLVLFSYAFFFEGFTGLAITIGSVITLFVVMQMTGRVRWAEQFAAGASTPSAAPR